MKYLIAALIYLVACAPAWAYLDPGTGSLVLQGVIALFATISVSIGMGWRYIKNGLRRILKRDRDDAGK